MIGPSRGCQSCLCSVDRGGLGPWGDCRLLFCCPRWVLLTCICSDWSAALGSGDSSSGRMTEAQGCLVNALRTGLDFSGEGVRSVYKQRQRESPAGCGDENVHLLGRRK